MFMKLLVIFASISILLMCSGCSSRYITGPLMYWFGDGSTCLGLSYSWHRIANRLENVNKLNDGTVFVESKRYKSTDSHSYCIKVTTATPNGMLDLTPLKELKNPVAIHLFYAGGEINEIYPSLQKIPFSLQRKSSGRMILSCIFPSCYLSLSNITVDELEAMSEQENITSLCLEMDSNYPLFSWDVLRKFPNLEELRLLNARVDSKMNPACTGKLTRVIFEKCKDVTIPEKSGISQIGLIDSTYGELFLKSLMPSNITGFLIKDHAMTDFSWIGNIKNCKTVKIQCKNFSNVYLLKDLVLIEKLYLDETSVTNISAVENIMPKLKELSLSRQAINSAPLILSRNIKVNISETCSCPWMTWNCPSF